MKISYETSRQKLIYIFGIDDENHRGLLKIGDTTFSGDIEAAAKERIDSYTRTAGIKYKLLHTELAVTDSGDAFRDYDVHRVLTNSKIKKISPAGTTAREWFKVTLPVAIQAIAAVKHGKQNLSDVPLKKLPKIIFRDEQEEAIARTVEYFGKKSNTRFLWNAKMRFGKTLCALEVVRRLKFNRTIIVTHRPVVNSGWYDDFTKIFRDGGFRYGDKLSKFSELFGGDKRVVYFASIQDLRGSETVGGGHQKNFRIFNTDWDCVIVDEAHEGTQTALGDKVISALVKPATKFLALSGTPFNILDDFDEDATFTWDYVDEQRAKKFWAENFREASPYADLPQMNILAYDLGALLGFVDEATFNFKEFFRTEDENFVHADAVEKFLNLLVTPDENNYPFANENFRAMFRHTLWIVPGVKEGRAMSAMLKRHKIFGAFEIVNVAGSGDSDDEPGDALEKVRAAINANDYTITLSCGKLTAGVTVPEWTAVLMLTGGSSATAYLQTIFRVQSPCKKFGVVKENCYVFDFAPDRTLNMLAESVAVNARAGKTRAGDRETLGELLSFCPVIAMRGSRMKRLDAAGLLTQLKRACAERAVRKGFDDRGLYNDELLKLDKLDIEKFNDLKKIIGTSDKKTGGIVINDSGLDKTESKKLRDNLKREPTPEEIDSRRRRNLKTNAIRILRGISIRMPLLIYGADVPIDEDITIDRFADLIDEASWEEFMPRGVTKEIFAGFVKYYDPEVFIAAGHQIRQRAKNADDLPPAERVEEISKIFASFKNPDKETVLTPWRVVDLHLNSLPAEIFSPANKILDINSKTGLYPLWIAQKIFAARTVSYGKLPAEVERIYWSRVVADNVFVLCKTPMAVKIARRTLLGFRQGTVHAKFFPDLIATLKTDPARFVAQITDKNFWNGGANLKFDAVVGNPPYQSAGNTGNFAAPVYHLFIQGAFKLADKVSLIHPARCLFNAGATPKDFNRELLSNPHVKVLRYEPDSTKLFPYSDIKGGVAITYYDADENFGAIDTFTAFDELNSILHKVVVSNKNFRPLSEIIYSRSAYTLTEKFHSENPTAADKMSVGNLSPIVTDIFERFPEFFLTDKPNDGREYIQMYGRFNGERVFRWIRRDYVNSPPPLTKFKVLVPDANGSGALGEVLSTPLVGSPLVGSTQTFISVGAFDTEAEAAACIAYIKTKFCRVMLGVLKVTQHNPPATWAKVPLENFTAASDIDWTKPVAQIDEQLYRKYNLSAAEIEFIERHVKAME